MPANTVKVDRTTKWGNPFGRPSNDRRGVRADRDRARVVENFRAMLERKAFPSLVPLSSLPCLLDRRDAILRDIAQLRGRNLACWCPLDKPCHADVLLEIANG